MIENDPEQRPVIATGNLIPRLIFSSDSSRDRIILHAEIDPQAFEESFWIATEVHETAKIWPGSRELLEDKINTLKSNRLSQRTLDGRWIRLEKVLGKANGLDR